MARERFSSEDEEKINKRALRDEEGGTEDEKIIREVLKRGDVSVPEEEIEESQIDKKDVQPEIETLEALKAKEKRQEGQFFGGVARIKEGNKQTKKEGAGRLQEKKEAIEDKRGEEPKKPVEGRIKQEEIKEDKESQIKEIKRALIFAIENGRNEEEIKFWKNKFRKFSGEDQLSPEELTACIRNFVGNLKTKLEKLNPEELKEGLIRISNLESMADQRIFGCPERDMACQELYGEIKNLRTIYAKIRGKQKEEPKMEIKEERKEEVKTEKKLPHEIELEQRPDPLKEESKEDWLERIGGPYVEVGTLKKCSKCGGNILPEEKHFCKATKEQKKEIPLIINQKGEFILNTDNIDTYFKKEEIDKRIEEGDPNIILNKEKGEYRFKKDFFGDLPSYCKIIAKQLTRERKIVADKRFGKSVEDWKKKTEEKTEEKKKPEKVEEPEKKKPGAKPETKEKPEKKPKKEKPEKKPEKKPGKEKAESKEGKKLDQARAKFIEAEKEYNRYGKGKWWSREIGTFFKGKGEAARVKEEYKRAMQEYEKARAEHVADHLDRFVDERMKIADGRAEKFEKSRWRKVWDWAGKQNLEKLGWKPKNKIARFMARGVNLRTIGSLGLLGTGIGFGIGSAVGVGALIAKRVYGGVATGMGSYELLKMGTERYPHLPTRPEKPTEKKLESVGADKAKEMMAKYEEKMVKYEEELKKKLESWDLDKTENMMAKYEMRAKLKGEKVSENENYQKIKDKYLELLKSESEKADKKLDVLMKAADERLGKMESKLKRGDRYRKVTAIGIAAIFGGIGIKQLMEKISGGPIEKLPVVKVVSVETKLPPARVIPAEVFGTKELPGKFTNIVQTNEGYIHEARKALTTYIHESGKPELGNLTKAQRVWAEDKLWDLYRETNPGATEKVLHVGDSVEFSRAQVGQVLNEVQEKFVSPEKIAKLSANLKDYVDNVKWDRYSIIHHPQMGEVYGWELDEGVRAVDWQHEVAGLKGLEPVMPEPSKTGLIGIEEPSKEIGRPVELIEQPAEPAPIEPTEKGLGISTQSRLEQFNEIGNRAISERIYDKYNLSPEAYNTIRNMPVRRFVNEFNYYRPPAYMMYRRASFLEIWGKILLRNTIRELLWGRPLHSRYMNTSVDTYLRLVGRMGRRWY